jgi:heme A synthase
LGYTVLVILWGAFVRATGAGAGCGSHWPLCNGVVIPRAPTVETLIELGHRLSSGVLGILVVAFNVFAFRELPPGHGARRFAFVSLLFVVAEALLGAGLVRFEWVASNVSQARVYVMAFHLVNTFLLLAAMTLTAWFAGTDGARRLRSTAGVALPIGGALLAVLVVGANGAVTALGDTLVLTAGIKPEESPLVAKLVAARFYHPTMAVAAFIFVVGVVLWLRPRVGPTSRRHGLTVLAIFGVQLLLGAVNVFLKAPVWLQLLHLGAADLLWIFLVLMTAEALTTARGTSPSAML